MDKNIERLADILGIGKVRLEEAINQVEEEAQEVGEHFYYNPDLFMGLVKPNMSRLAKLVVPDLSRLKG